MMEDRKVKMKVLSHLVVFNSLRPHRLQPTRPLRPRDSPGQNTGVGCHSPFPGNPPDPGTEPGSPALQAYSLSSESPRNQETRISDYSICQGNYKAVYRVLET